MSCSTLPLRVRADAANELYHQRQLALPGRASCQSVRRSAYHAARRPYRGPRGLSQPLLIAGITPRCCLVGATSVCLYSPRCSGDLLMDFGVDKSRVKTMSSENEPLSLIENRTFLEASSFSCKDCPLPIA